MKIFACDGRKESCMKSKFRVIAAILLVITLFFALLLSAFAGNGNDYDYTHRGSPENTVISGTSILEGYLGKTVSEYEREFLARFSDISLTYSAVIPTERVSTEYDADADTLTVVAESYTYTSDGKSFSWIPVSVEYVSEEYTYTHGEPLVISSVEPPQADAAVTVRYTAEVSVEAADINILSNLLYDTAEYLGESENYIAALEEYREYLHEKMLYDEALAKYNKYLADKEEYDGQLYAYENYENAVSEYNASYAKYLEYLAKLEAMSDETEVYEAYLAKLSTVREHLKILDTAKVEMTDGRSLYSAILGSTVDSVIENKSVFTSDAYGASAEVIDMAAESTENLRALLKEYYAKSTEEKKYNYYIINYDRFCEAFYGLTASLDNLYRIDQVRKTLVFEGKEKKYLILVAQLALVTDCLTDGDVKDLDGKVAYNTNWKIANQTVNQILENKTYLTDTDSAAPLAEGYPQEVKRPDYPEEVAKPERPVRPQKPVAPQPVDNPGTAPKTVEPPVEPVASERVIAITKSLSQNEKELLARRYNADELSQRAETTAPYAFVLSTELTRSLAPTDYAVSFYSEQPESSDIPIYVTEAEKGTPAVFEGQIPEKTSDAEFDYVFSGWQTLEGEPVSLLSVEGELKLVPIFQSVRKSYKISWIVEGTTFETLAEYGSIPTWQGAEPPKKADEGDYTYVFTGWSTEPCAVSGEAEYVAQFERRYLLPLSSGGAAISDDGSVITADCGLSTDTEFDIATLVSRAAGSRGIVLKTAHGEVSFSYSETAKLKAAGVCKLSLSVINKGNVSYVYGVSLLNPYGQSVSHGSQMQLALACSLTYSDALVLYSVDGGERNYKSFGLANGVLSFSADAGKIYTLTPEYSVSVHSGELVSISSSVSVAVPGATVTLEIALGDGALLDRIIVTASDGTPIQLIGGKSFIMPSADVDVAAVVRLKTYTVTFVSDGKVVSTQRLEHGQIPQTPSKPTKYNDGKYSYKFLGWSPKIAEAKGDTVYEAVYEKTLLPPKPKQDGLIISDRVKKILIIAVVLLSLAFIGLVCGIVFLVRHILKKKRGTPTAPDGDDSPQGTDGESSSDLPRGSPTDTDVLGASDGEKVGEASLEPESPPDSPSE